MKDIFHNLFNFFREIIKIKCVHLFNQLDLLFQRQEISYILHISTMDAVLSINFFLDSIWVKTMPAAVRRNNH